MTRKIFQSIIAVVISVLLLSLALITGVLYNHFETTMLDQLRTTAQFAEQGVEQEGMAYFDSLHAQNCRVTWIAADGTVKYDNRSNPKTMENHADRQEVREAMENDSGTSVRRSSTLSEHTMYYAKRLSDGTVLRLSMSQRSVLFLMGGMLSPLVFIFLAACLLAGVLSYRVSKKIVKPLSEIDLKHPEQVETYDELSPFLQRIAAQNREIDARMAEIRKQQQAEYRTGIDSRVRDATAAYMRGVDFPDAPSQTDFLAAYGVREGNLRYTEFRNTQIAGQYIGSFRSMPTSSITAYVEQLRPGTEETGEGYASRAELFDQVSAAATKVITQRQNNPFNAAVEIGAYKPIASNNPNDITAEVANRFSSQESLQALGINAPILNSEEAATLAQQVRGTQNVDQTIKLLQSMGETLPAPAMRQVASAIAPSSAATAYSALLLGTPDNQYDNTKPTIPYSQFIGYKPTMNKYDVSKVILAGDQLLNPTKAMKDAGITPVKLPSEDKLKRAFDDQVGNAFANNPQARQLSYSLFKSAYAGIAYQSGDSAMTRTDAANSDVVEKAAQYATGGVYKGFNGGDVVMPFGMDKSTFKDRYTASAQQALKDAGLNENAASNFTPVNIGNNQYRLVSGSGRWATNPGTREPIVVRVE